MDKFTCNACGKIWDIEEYHLSIEQFGFVSLVGDNDEWIGFNCPNNYCHSTVYRRLPLNAGRAFYNEFLNPAGFNDYYCHFSSPPFSRSSYTILDNFDVLDYSQSAWEVKEGIGTKLWCSPARCFSSCNHSIPSFFSRDVREYIYKISDVERLFERETRDKIRLFPRYVRNLSIFRNVDRFFHSYYSPNSSIIKSSINFEVKSNELLSPMIFYNVLAVPPTSPDLEEMDERLKQQGLRHSEIIRKIHRAFQDGSLSKRLLSLADEFAQNYAENFAHYRLCADTLWEFKENYLEVLYQELTSGDLPKDNNPKRKHPDALVKEQCKFLAKKLHENDTTLSAREIALSPEMKRIAKRPYREPGRENEIKIFPYRKILEWVKEAVPDCTHPKSGRPKNKPRPR